MNSSTSAKIYELNIIYEYVDLRHLIYYMNMQIYEIYGVVHSLVNLVNDKLARRSVFIKNVSTQHEKKRIGAAPSMGTHFKTKNVQYAGYGEL